MQFEKEAGGEPYIRATVLLGFAELIAPTGEDPARFLKAAGIPPAALSNVDMLVSWRALGRLMERTARELDKPAIGLEWALSLNQPYPCFGPVTLLTLEAATVRDWIARSLAYWRLHTNAYVPLLIEDDPALAPDAAMLRFEHGPLAFPSRHKMEYSIAGTCVLARAVIGFSDETLREVRFQHQPPADLALYEKVFRCPVVFGAAHDEIVFARAVLDGPLAPRFGPLKSLFGAFMRHRLQTRRAYDLPMRRILELAIPILLGTGTCSFEFIAQALGLNPKKLQRLLAQENTSFSEVLSHVRKTMACQMLAETDAPIASIAGLLDYSKATPFSVAFRRWTGLAPREFRKRARALALEGADAAPEAAREPWYAEITQPATRVRQRRR